MVYISRDSMEFYVPPSRAHKPHPSVRRTPPKSSTAAVTASAIVTVSASGPKTQAVEARSGSGRVPANVAEMAPFLAKSDDAHAANGPIAIAQSVKRVQSNDSPDLTTLFLSDISPFHIYRFLD